MKLKPLTLSFLVCLALGLSVATAQAHDHGHEHPAQKKAAGPNGGRILTGLEPRAEFFVTAERKVQITFLSEDGKAIAPAEQVVTVFTGDRSAPTKLTFSKSGNALVSGAPLPNGDDFPTVVQIKPAPSATMVSIKFNLNLANCPECNHAEYACTCESH